MLVILGQVMTQRPCIQDAQRVAFNTALRSQSSAVWLFRFMSLYSVLSNLHERVTCPASL